MTTRSVVLDGGAPWGFRIHGGVDQQQPLRISRVNPGSKAALRGIREGDVITSINGQSTKDLSNSEAHGFLRNSGDFLKLGLNENYDGTLPNKRRQYKTVHEETFSETLKRSSTTSYSLTTSKTISETEENNRASKINPYDEHTPEEPTSFSSTSTETGITSDVVMSDNNGLSKQSRSKRKRSRRKNKCQTLETTDYRVDSPSELKTTAKSKSLDDLDQPTIREVQSDSEDKTVATAPENNDQKIATIAENNCQRVIKSSDNKNQCSTDNSEPIAIVTEVDSDLENDVLLEEIALMSPEEELSLRNFLEGLNLVNSPEDAAKQACEISTIENVKTRRAKKRAAIEQYFSPMMQQPRFLEVINEESSDVSDREVPLVKNLKRGTPESDLPPLPPKGKKKIKQGIKPVTLITRVIETPRVLHAVLEPPSEPEVIYLDSSGSDSPETKSNEDSGCPFSFIENNDSLPTSNSNHSPENAESLNLESEESDKDASQIQDPKNTNGLDNSVQENGYSNSSEINIQCANLVLDETPQKISETPIIPMEGEKESKSEVNNNDETKQSLQVLHNPISDDPKSRNGKEVQKSSETQQQQTKGSRIDTENLKDSKTPEEQETTEMRSEFSVFIKKDDVLVTKTETKSCQYEIRNSFDNKFLSELTPPPTPDEMSPKNEMSSKIFVSDGCPCDVVPDSKISPKNLEDRSSSERFEDLSSEEFQSSDESYDFKPSSSNTNGLTTPDDSSCSNVLCPSEESSPTKNELNEQQLVATLSCPVPSRSPSLSSDSSSRATSLCTVKTNPMNSSIADMSSICRDEELPKIDPSSLRELCVSYLLSQPFGLDILQELADVSWSIETFTNNLSGTFNVPELRDKCVRKMSTEHGGVSNSTLVNNTIWGTLKQNGPKWSLSVSDNKPMGEEWFGLLSDNDPNLVACLSPKQKEELEKSNKCQDEANNLVDLHSKFIYRTTSQSVKRHEEDQVLITAIKPNRLFHIMKQQPQNIMCKNIEVETSPKTTDQHQSPREQETLDKRRNENNANNLNMVLVDGKLDNPKKEDVEGARLKAKDLNEWLQLARVKHSTNNTGNIQKRPNSLQPQDLHLQMQQLLEKEREIQRELVQIEEEKLFLTNQMTSKFNVDDFHISKNEDFAEKKAQRPLSMPTEFFRQQMYDEYMSEIAVRQERKQHKVIKVTSPPEIDSETKSAAGIEDEFMNCVKRKQESGKLQIGEEPSRKTSPIPNQDDSQEPVLVIDGNSLKEARILPKHLKEFIDITTEPQDGVWSPGQSYRPDRPPEYKPPLQQEEGAPISPVWVPKSANSSPVVERKEFKPVKFESPVLGRKSYGGRNETQSTAWKGPETNSDTGINSSTLEKRLPTSHSSPSSGFHDFSNTRLPKAQNPTITLLQKAREGQLPRGASYIDPEPNYKLPQPHYNDRPPPLGPSETLYRTRSGYMSESDADRPQRLSNLRIYEGFGPTTKDGMPLILRSEVKDADQSKWYKKMYDTIHKQRPHRDEYVTVRYKQRRGQYPYSSGYLSEPEPGAYDSDFTDYKYATLDRRRVPIREKENDYQTSSTLPRPTMETKSSSDLVKHSTDQYENKPGKIENYQPGKSSSIYDKEAKRWWDEVMDIFDGQLEQQKKRQWYQPQPKSFINQALKESGYESDSTLVFRRKEEANLQLSPQEQRLAYKEMQKGGDVPLHGFRKPAPERPKEPEPPAPPPKGQHTIRNLQVNTESPRKYVENEVTIHYKTPVRQEIKDYLSEDELAHRQAENMKKIYQEERRRKYLQELQDMNNRRHTDHFIPSQKSPIALNRYDDFEVEVPSPQKSRPKSPESRLMARALYNFVGQSARELTFRKGDTIHVRRQVDKNWYEGELNAMVGLFPVNYVEIIPYDSAISTPRKPHEGQARAKFNFVAQTHLELSLAKGELVVLTRKVDDNWYEGKIGGRKGIFPVSYVDVLIEPGESLPPSTKPVASPAAHSLLINGTTSGKESMGSHSYTPILTSSSVHAKPAQVVSTNGTYGTVGGNKTTKSPVNQALHIETQSEPIPFRALYKYLPQNDDELELLEGDTVYVLEKCDDGWYVGSSDRTGAFGTFPGNYVEKI